MLEQNFPLVQLDEWCNGSYYDKIKVTEKLAEKGLPCLLSAYLFV